MRIICPNCGQSYSERFASCPICGHPTHGDDTDALLEESLETPAEEGGVPPTLPTLDVQSEQTEPPKTGPVRRRGDTDTGPIHSFAFGEEDDDDATVRRPARPVPQPRQYYQDTDETERPSYAPRYAKQRRRNDRVPVWMVVTISVVLGLALIIGGLTMAFALGVFDRVSDDPVQTPDTSGSTGLQVQQDTTPTEPDAEINTDTDTPDAPSEGNTTVGAVTVVDETPGTESGAESGTESGDSDEFPVETIPTEDEPEEELPPVDCDSITLDNVDFTLAFRGDNYTLTATTEPAEAAQYVTWESSDPVVATVDENGRVEARSKGTVTVTATCGEQTARCVVRCEQLPPASSMINLSAEDVTISNAGETVTMRILDELTDEELAALTWTSSKPEVASVDADGVVTALSGGTATITAQSGERIGTCLVRCAFSGDGSYKISHSDVTMSYIGEYFNLYVTHDGVRMTEITWFTSDSTVASVNDMGVVTATGVGTATITTVVDGNSLQCIVRVRDDS